MPVPAIPPSLRQELEEIYSEVERAIGSLGVACWGHGDCCNFERCDHRLYASSLEIAYVIDQHPLPFAPGSCLCPFWKEGRCTERERRPLGCRTYFCDTRYRVALEDLHERCYRRLRDASVRAGFPWSYELFVAALRNPSHPLYQAGARAPEVSP